MALDESDDELKTLTPEIRAMMGVFALYWKLDEGIESINVEPALADQECHMIIRLDEPRRMGVMARLMLTVPSAITAAADSLENLGYIERKRDPADRRAWLLQLTEAGWERRRQMEQTAGELFRATAGLSPEETRIFAELADKIHDNVMRNSFPEGLAKCE
ncbi:MarR family transcriptional regulator [Aliisedimentitalea scapharcae]|uniref:MarR family transcriptional regulator n=1 Tax=Aliisedimentitalea scapharcae TaxID=1524259 RepID=A0ABZ2XTX4_9RHOB